MNEPKIGQLCRFANGTLTEDKLIDILKDIDNFLTGEIAYIAESGGWFDVCLPLTKEEIQQFMELAE